MSVTLGIDLGTTCSAVGVVVQGSPRLLDLGGGHLVPSVVSYPREGRPLIGQAAVNQRLLEPHRTVSSSKRWMGSNHAWTFDGTTVDPVDVATAILEHLARASAAAGHPADKVVITVPAWFSQIQRMGTRQAGERAGLEVVRLLNEPTAAALAHAHGQEVSRRCLVYDFGGGTFDVSLVEQDGPVVEVRASHGDSQLGGDDVDQALRSLVLERLDRHLRARISEHPAAMIRLLDAVEQAKIRLSETLHTTVRVPFVLGPEHDAHVELPLARDDLDEAVAPFLERTIASVQHVLDDVGISPREIDDLILVGGSTFLPQVWDGLKDHFGLEGSHAIPPRDAVALGAAIQGAIIDGDTVDGILVDVAPFSLSVGSIRDYDTYGCTVITPRNSSLPARHSRMFYTTHPHQREVRIPIFQGGSVDPRHNLLLGQIAITDLRDAPEGADARPIRVEMRHDLDGTVDVSVVDALTGRAEACRLAADGEEQAEAWTTLVAELEGSGLVMVSGSAEHAPTRASTPAPSARETAGDDAVDEAVGTFQAVLDADLDGDPHGLRAMATEGLGLLERGEHDAALAVYDALCDEMFAHGVYL